MTWSGHGDYYVSGCDQPQAPFGYRPPAMASSSSTALKSFSLANDVLTVSPQDKIYKFDVELNKKINRDAPWTKESVGTSA